MPKDTATARLRVTLGQWSEAGRKPLNQDFHGALVPRGPALTLKGIVVALADGISTGPRSREAAEMAVKCLLTDYYDTPEGWTARAAGSRVIAAANAWLHGRNAGAGAGNGEGRIATLAALILKGRAAHLLHVGDSRVWRLAGQALEPLTADHRISTGPGEDYLARALGAAPRIEVDYRRLPVEEGDVFVLTTDGVHDVLSGPAMARFVAAEPPEQAARALVRAALAAGSTDNVTAQVVRIDALPADGADLVPEDAALPVPPLPAPGDTLDGLRILRPLHASARSHVFLAEAPGGGKVALKIPAGDLAADPAALRRFMAEDWIARRVDAPQVVRPVDPPAPRSALYVATRHVEGTTLRQWMTDTPHPPRETVQAIVAQLVEGLRALHRRGMLHQDLRPENVMIDAEGRVTIIDLGSVAVPGVDEAAPGTLGALPGTFQYTAPEYLSGDAVSWRSDQYALGVIAYEMLTGRLPYGAQVARIRSRADQRRLAYRPASDDDSGVPGWIDAALRRAVHPDPLRRYDALSEFVVDLRRPGAGWRAGRHLPLAARDPLRFWQGLSAALAVLCLILAARGG